MKALKSFVQGFLFTLVLLVCSIAFNSSGQVPPFDWASRAGGPGDDFSRGIAVDSSGNLYVTGAFHETANFGNIMLTSSGGYDIFVAKYDNAGNVLWANSAGGPNFDDYGLGIACDPQGNCYVTGAFSGQASFGTNMLNDVGGSDIFVAKYDTAGNLLWVQQAGGVSLNSGRAIAADAAGNCYVTGVFQGTGPFGNTNLTAHSVADYDIFVAKYDTEGNLVWVQQAGGNLDDVGYGIALDPSGDCYVTGYFKSPTATFGSYTLVNSSTTNSPDIFVAKYDSAGNVLWAKQAGGPDVDSGYAIGVDQSSNCYVAGVFSGTARFGSMTLSNSGAAHFLARFDSAGNVVWAQQVGGGTDDGCGSVTVDAAGNPYFTGWFSGTANFGTTNLTSMGLDDIFVAKMDRSGNPLWVKQAGGTNYDRGYGLSVDSFGNSYVAGFFAGTSHFDSFTLVSAGGYDSVVARLEGPRLKMARLPNNVVITWPTNAAGLILQSTFGLDGPLNWSNSPDVPAIVGDQYTVTNNASGLARFYRLKNP